MLQDFNMQQAPFLDYEVETDSNKIIQIGIYKYQVSNRIGKSGIGQIFYYEKSDYMVKMIDKTQHKGRELGWDQHLLNTIEKMKNLNHPNIVKILDVFNKPDKIYIVMERAKLLKTQLEENIFQNQSQQKKQIDEFNYQMMMAIRYIHEQKLILSHLDTSSIGIVKNTQGISYKIIQFDYTYQLKPDNSQRLLIFPSSFNVAPEIQSGKQSTEKSDIYCLGLVMYEFIENGKFLFDVLNEIKHQKFQNARILQMDKELHEILQVMISFDGKNRIASFDLVQRNYFLKLSQIVFLKLIQQSQKYSEFEKFFCQSSKK